MMESDDEADYRRRDKFRSERGSGPGRYTGEGPPGGRGGRKGGREESGPQFMVTASCSCVDRGVNSF